MGRWMCIRKLNKWHWLSFFHYYHHIPTDVCLTDNKEWHLGIFNRMLEIGSLTITPSIGENNEKIKRKEDRCRLKIFIWHIR